MNAVERVLLRIRDAYRAVDLYFHRYEGRTWYEGRTGGDSRDKPDRARTTKAARFGYSVGRSMHLEQVRHADYWCPNPAERESVRRLARDFRGSVTDRKTGEVWDYRIGGWS